MRPIGSILVISLLLIAFGRCVTEQYGMLHTTTASCCQTICTACTHPDGTPGQHSEEEHNNHETPSPCHLCEILNNDSVQLASGIKLPCPVISEFSPDFEPGTWMDALLSRICSQVPPLDLDTDLPDPPPELGSMFRCLVCKVAPVRGPSIV